MVFPGTRRFRQARALYISAFPAPQRRPFLSLWLLSVCKPAVSLRTYSDNGQFCGFTCAVQSEKYLYLNFIAVNPALRSKGYGGQILDLLRQQAPQQALLVEVERPDPDAPNYSQRCARVAFYRRNGFYDLDRTITGHGATFMLMSTDPVFDRDAYWSIFPQMSLGLRASLKRLLGRSAKK